MHHRNRYHPALALALALTVLLGACAPSAGRATFGASVDVHLDTNLAYHPRQAGITRTYQAEGDPGRYLVTEHGPTHRDGLTQYLTHAIGLGRDTTTYRTHTRHGVFRLHDEHASHTVTYHPPLHEYPPILAVGQRWGGTSNLTFGFPDKNIEHHDTIEYQYAVIERRSVTINGRRYDAYVIDFTATQTSDGARITQQHWYAPHAGVVRTVDQLYLTSTNLPRSTR